MRIDLHFTPHQTDELALREKTVVVIDVLRASTTIVTALSNGAREIIPVATVESAVAWQAAIERKDGPSSLVFSRQALAHMPRSDEQIAAIRRGGYTLIDCQGKPQAIIIATGSEV